jgi:hypothetical protein
MRVHCTALPVGAMPMKSPWWVPRRVTSAITVQSSFPARLDSKGHGGEVLSEGRLHIRECRPHCKDDLFVLLAEPTSEVFEVCIGSFSPHEVHPAPYDLADFLLPDIMLVVAICYHRLASPGVLALPARRIPTLSATGTQIQGIRSTNSKRSAYMLIASVNLAEKCVAEDQVASPPCRPALRVNVYGLVGQAPHRARTSRFFASTHVL